MSLKILELIKIRNHLTNLSTANLDLAISKLMVDINSLNTDALNTENLKIYSSKLFDTSVNIHAQVNQLVEEIDNKIEIASKPYLLPGYQINGKSFVKSEVELERYRSEAVYNLDVEQHVFSKIAGFTNWKYPSLELGPGDGKYTSWMIAADPLYIADIHQEFLDNTLKQFNEIYQKRVRSYLIESDNLLTLPINQFGFIFAWNLFEYFEFEKVRHYLEQCYNLLRPGGCILFTYNDCESLLCAEHFISGFKTWNTKTLMEKTLKELNYNVSEFNNFKDMNWIFAFKPGTLTTVKGSQSLGEIITPEIAKGWKKL